MNQEQHYHSRLSMALDDLLRCKAYCQQMLKLPIGESFSSERTVYEALFVSLIVSYGRVFTSSETTEKEHKGVVSNLFGEFRASVVKALEPKYQKLHTRIMDKRHTAIAHSDANARNYQHYNDSVIGIGRNPYYPYEHDEVRQVIILVESLISEIAVKQTEIGKVAFKNHILYSS
ncbi:hypothetical protein NRI80_003451 [Vibrio cholerae]|nr:hypothetical protein [Vibrio cholerae]EJO4004598.1 hypothetical protein [Vibrio cholerae]